MGHESPWGWMVVGVLLGLLGAFGLVVSESTGVTIGAIAACAVGGTVVFVSGVAAGVANGMARHEHLSGRR